MKELKLFYNENTELQKLLLDLLCKIHVEYIYNNPSFIKIRNAIIAGAFTSKIKTEQKDKKVYIDKNIYDLNIELIDKFNDLCQEMEKLNFYIKDEPFYCYRVIDNESIIDTDIGSTININPIPVSATFDINMAKKWSANKDNFSILKIELREYLNYVIIDKLYDRDSEIILPTGHVIIEDKDDNFYTCSYHMVNYKVVKCSENGFCKCSDSRFCIFTKREIEELSKMNIVFSGERKKFIKRKK